MISNSFLSTAIVTAQAPAESSGQAADVVREDIQWMPPGTQHIVPSVNGKPTEMTVTVDQAFAHRIIADFGRLRSEFLAGNGDEPFIDYSHRNQEAAGHPSEIYWAGPDPKTGGIRAKVTWTKAGRAALQDKAYTRFSPSWKINPETGDPVGLYPNLGGLVNHAAFSTIQRVRAGATGGSEHEQQMTPEIQAAITAAVTTALTPINAQITALATAQASAKAATTAPVQAGATDPALVNRIEALERSMSGSATAHADRCITAAVQAGRLAPQDTAAAGFWRGAIASHGAQAEAQLAALPVNPAFVRLVQAGSSGGPNSTATLPDTAEQFVATVAAKVTAGASKASALTAAINENPKAYNAWREADGKPGL